MAHLVADRRRCGRGSDRRWSARTGDRSRNWVALRVVGIGYGLLVAVLLIEEARQRMTAMRCAAVELP
jgi:hypothetical protein